MEASFKIMHFGSHDLWFSNSWKKKYFEQIISLCHTIFPAYTFCNLFINPKRNFQEEEISKRELICKAADKFP